jgi:hypothetical protein
MPVAIGSAPNCSSASYTPRPTRINAKFDTGIPPTANKYEVILVDA